VITTHLIVISIIAAGFLACAAWILLIWWFKRAAFRYAGMRVRYAKGALRNQSWDDNTKRMIRAIQRAGVEAYSHISLNDTHRSTADIVSDIVASTQLIWYPPGHILRALKSSKPYYGDQPKYSGIWEPEDVLWTSRPTAHCLQAKQKTQAIYHGPVEHTAFNHEIISHALHKAFKGHSNFFHDPHYLKFDELAIKYYWEDVTWKTQT